MEKIANSREYLGQEYTDKYVQFNNNNDEAASLERC